MKNKKEFHVYVIGLKKSAMNDKKCIKQNPNYQIEPNKRCYYVGYTGEIPEIRYQKHITSHKTKSGIDTSSPVVRKHGFKRNGLRPKQYKKYNPIYDEDVAKNIEHELANKLRTKGHFVYQK